VRILASQLGLPHWQQLLPFSNISTQKATKNNFVKKATILIFSLLLKNYRVGKKTGILLFFSEFFLFFEKIFSKNIIYSGKNG